MSYEIRFTEDFKKRSAKFIKRHGDIRERYAKTLFVLQENPFHPSLRLHKLKGNLHEYYSVSINMEYRIIMDFILIDGVVIPIDIGSHDDVY